MNITLLFSGCQWNFKGRKGRTFLFNYTLNTFYLQLYGVGAFFKCLDFIQIVGHLNYMEIKFLFGLCMLVHKCLYPSFCNKLLKHECSHNLIYHGPHVVIR